jgi:hypothetical protein
VLLGEHTDWIASYQGKSSEYLAKGVTIVCATNEGLYAKCSRHLNDASSNTSDTLLFESLDNHNVASQFEAPLHIDHLSEIALRGFFFFCSHFFFVPVSLLRYVNVTVLIYCDFNALQC